MSSDLIAPSPRCPQSNSFPRAEEVSDHRKIDAWCGAQVEPEAALFTMCQTMPLPGSARMVSVWQGSAWEQQQAGPHLRGCRPRPPNRSRPHCALAQARQKGGGANGSEFESRKLAEVFPAVAVGGTSLVESNEQTSQSGLPVCRWSVGEGGRHADLLCCPREPAPAPKRNMSGSQILVDDQNREAYLEL